MTVTKETLMRGWVQLFWERVKLKIRRRIISNETLKRLIEAADLPAMSWTLNSRAGGVVAKSAGEPPLTVGPNLDSTIVPHDQRTFQRDVPNTSAPRSLLSRSLEPLTIPPLMASPTAVTNTARFAIRGSARPSQVANKTYIIAVEENSANRSAPPPAFPVHSSPPEMAPPQAAKRRAPPPPAPPSDLLAAPPPPPPPQIAPVAIGAAAGQQREVSSGKVAALPSLVDAALDKPDPRRSSEMAATNDITGSEARGGYASRGGRSRSRSAPEGKIMSPPAAKPAPPRSAAPNVHEQSVKREMKLVTADAGDARELPATSEMVQSVPSKQTRNSEGAPSGAKRVGTSPPRTVGAAGKKTVTHKQTAAEDGPSPESSASTFPVDVAALERRVAQLTAQLQGASDERARLMAQREDAREQAHSAQAALAAARAEFDRQRSSWEGERDRLLADSEANYARLYDNVTDRASGVIDALRGELRAALERTEAEKASVAADSAAMLHAAEEARAEWRQRTEASYAASLRALAARLEASEADAARQRDQLQAQVIARLQAAEDQRRELVERMERTAAAAIDAARAEAAEARAETERQRLDRERYEADAQRAFEAHCRAFEARTRERLSSLISAARSQQTQHQHQHNMAPSSPALDPQLVTAALRASSPSLAASPLDSEPPLAKAFHITLQREEGTGGPAPHAAGRPTESFVTAISSEASVSLDRGPHATAAVNRRLVLSGGPAATGDTTVVVPAAASTGGRGVVDPLHAALASLSEEERALWESLQR